MSVPRHPKPPANGPSLHPLSKAADRTAAERALESVEANSTALDGASSSEMSSEEMERRLYNARHGLADEARGGNLAERDREGNLVHALGANYDEGPRKTVEIVTTRKEGVKPAVPPSQSADPRRDRKPRERTAWSRLRARMRAIPRLRVETVEQGVRLWADERRHVREVEEHFSRSPLAGMGTVLPTGAPKRHRRVGDSARLQAARWLESVEGFGLVARDLRAQHGLPVVGRNDEGDGFRCAYPRMTLAGFLERVAERLPVEFMEPSDPTCEAEIDEIEAQDREDEKQAQEERKAGDDGRLLPGMRRAE